MCWQIAPGSRRLCVPTALDTGSTDAVLFSADGAAPTGTLAAGESLTAWRSPTDTTPLWAFISGSSTSDDLVRTAGDGRLALMDTGVEAFFAFDVTYDAGHARMYLTRSAALASQPAWRRAAVAVCTRFNATSRAALAAPKAGPASTLTAQERALIHYDTTWGSLSLRLMTPSPSSICPRSCAPSGPEPSPVTGWARACCSSSRGQSRATAPLPRSGGQRRASSAGTWSRRPGGSR